MPAARGLYVPREHRTMAKFLECPKCHTLYLVNSPVQSIYCDLCGRTVGSPGRGWILWGVILGILIILAALWFPTTAPPLSPGKTGEDKRELEKPKDSSSTVPLLPPISFQWKQTQGKELHPHD